MEPEMYRGLILNENRHWWFLGRRVIARWVLRQAKLPENAQVLDIGCGAGGNMVMLAHYGQVHGMEYEPSVREHAQSRNIGPVEDGKLPERFAYGDKKFDLVTLFDVLEHIDEDRESLQAIHGRLNAGGYLLITVPAFEWMSSQHDVINHHKRRYTRGQLKKLLKQTGYEICLINYFNFWLFPAAVIIRLLERFSRHNPQIYRQTLGQSLPSPPINRFLAWLLGSDRFLLKLPLPFGISIVALARKTQNEA